VMTVHGSKGLQAPVVILADACVDPDRSRGGSAQLRLDEDVPPVPIFRPRADELCEPLKSQIERQDRLEREEHWRLLYVGMTRAEERLFVGGALGAVDRKGPPQTSWYAAIATSMGELGCEWQDDPVWGRSCRFGGAPEGDTGGKATASVAPAAPLPAWVRAPAPVEARPPRPIAPSAALEDEAPNPPPSPELRAAAERGRLLHQLFERLPDVPADERRSRADAWLRDSAGVDDEAIRSDLIDRACGIISHADFAALFSGEALAEAPVAAVTPGGAVITGTVDRLLVDDEVVRLVDFKTGRTVPDEPAAIPASHLRQMAAYQLALETIFPGRRVEAALLYSAAPLLHPLPRSLLEPYMAALEGEGRAPYMAAQ